MIAAFGAVDREVRMGQNPDIGAVVVLRDPAEKAFTSRVEGVPLDDRLVDGKMPLGTVITVTRPLGIPAADPYELGTSFEVMWTRRTGLAGVPVELVETRSEQRVRLWDLKVVGEQWTEQRREFVRVAAFGRVSVRSDLIGADATVIGGYVVDLSEAAMQASLWVDAEDPRVAVGAPVTIEFYAGRTTFTREGLIYATRPGASAREVWVVIQFDQSPTDADTLRSEVFAVQVQMRRTWRRMRDEPAEPNTAQV